jgi:ribonuclease P/MRP protein subunit POP3
MPSKGKRSKKRKLQEAKLEQSNALPMEAKPIPIVPSISSHLLIGLRSITRHLETLSRSGSSRKLQLQSGIASVGEGSENIAELLLRNGAVETILPHLAAVFVCRSSQPSVLHAHLLQLVATASLAHPLKAPTRLVQLPRGAENRLCSSLALPRASFIGILEDAPNSKVLIDLVRGLVSKVEVPWLAEAQSAQYKPVKINTIITTAPSAR